MVKQILILGAGISGLTLAWSLQKEKDVHITLIEKEARIGGWVDTLHSEGYLFERGPRSFRTQGAGTSTLQLIEALGLEKEIISAAPTARYRYLYQNQTLHRVPNNPIHLLTSPLSKGVFSALWKDWKTKGGPGNDESIATFVERRLGKEIADRFFDPLVSGIFAGDIQKLSLRACFPSLAEWEDKNGGLLRGALSYKKKSKQLHSPFVQTMLKQPLLSFKRGMETLTQSLAAQFKGEILLGHTAESIGFEESPSHPQAIVRLANGKILYADALYSTLPASSLGKLLAPRDPKLANRLKQIPSASIAIVSLGYQRPILKQKGFGYLIPSSEGETTLGVIWDSCVFPQQACYSGETRLTVMLGGSRMENFNTWTPTQFILEAKNALSRHLGIDAT